MKLIIAGSRYVDSTNKEICHISAEIIQKYTEKHIGKVSGITEIVSGHALGIDRCGEDFASNHNIKIKIFPYMHEYGKRGGMMRNLQMGRYADNALVFVNNESKGSGHMVKTMLNLNKPVTAVFLGTAKKQITTINLNQTI